MEKTNKKYLIFMAVSLVIIFTSGFSIISLVLDMKENSEDYLQTKKDLKVLTVKAEQLESEDHNQVKGMIANLEAMFTDSKKPVKDIIFLEKTIKENNLKGEVKIGEKNVQSKPWPYIYFNVQAEGSVEQIFSFLESLKEEKRIISIEKVDINNLNAEENANAEIKLKLYFLNN